MIVAANNFNFDLTIERTTEYPVTPSIYSGVDI
ncbi:hypothetical protein J2Z66_007654 [Paenibacillus eucommiae]|uniref:Uncharacterized protein n=1 Tax=Paenibacillus eucommiae TaxID=1355755 RepID=A0ABS4J9U2_9BACL|nr:hypothetical protein [Paenibacillus eucommiae]